MVEDIAECDDALMDKYLETGELSPEELKTGLQKGRLFGGALIPVVCGSAMKKHRDLPVAGLDRAALLPSPVDRGTGDREKTGNG